MKKLILVLMTSLAMVAVKAATHTVLNVNDSGAGSLRSMIALSASQDTIQFDPILLAGGSDTITLLSEIAFNKGLTINGLISAIGDTLFISGNQNVRIFNINLGSSSYRRMRFNNVALVNGNAGTSSTSSNGGAIRLIGASYLYLNNSLIKGNQAYNGGGVYCYQNISNTLTSYIYIDNSIISYNNASYRGGGVYNHRRSQSSCYAHTFIINSKIENNVAQSSGGGVFSLAFTSSNYGNGHSSVNVDFSSISNNSSITEHGGGIYSLGEANSYIPSSFSDVDVDHSTIANNSAAIFGGGIYSKCYSNTTYGHNSFSWINLKFSTIYGNSASDTGGGVYSDNRALITSTNSSSTATSRVYTYYSTVYSNSAPTAGGIFSRTTVIGGSGNSISSIIYALSSIIAENGLNSNVIIGGANFYSGGYNIFSDAPVGSVASDQTNITNAQLNLGALQNNGGYTETLMPLFGSVAINNGNTSLGSAQNSPIIGVREVGAAEYINYITWTGATSADWFTGSNWSTGVVPTTSDIVTIPDVSGASGNFPLITPAITLGNVTVNVGASVTVVTGIELEGTFINNGSVTLQDGAYLDNFTNGGASYTGDITVETVAANGVTDDQRFISSPVNSPMFSEIADDLNGPWGTGAQGVNGVAVTVDDCSIPTLTSTSNYGNLFELNETLITNNAQCELEAWVVRSSGMLENARGYSAYLTNGSTFELSGTPNTGNIQVNATNTGSTHALAEGWNLLGNPYPSPVKRNDVIAAGATDVQYFVTSGVYQGSFSAYNPGENIAIAQGFQAHVNTTGMISFDNSMRTTAAATWYQNDEWFEYKLEVSVFGTNYADRTTLFYNNDATNSYEPLYDVRKRKSNAGHPTLSTIGANLDLTLNGMSVNDLGETVSMNLESGANGIFTLSFEGMTTFPANTTIYVKDLQENVVHNIANGDYTFTATTTDNAARFEIILVPAVELATTKVDCEGNAGKIQLTSTDFTNDRTFEIIANNQVIATNDLVNLNESLLAGSYILNVNDQFGGIQVYAIEIEAAEQIEADFTVSNTELLVGEVLLLNNTTTNATTVEWNIENTALSNVNNATYTFTEAGIYEVEMNVSNEECADVKTETITVTNKTTGIETVNGEVITFYPNPATDILNINATTNIHIEIVDVLGKIVVKTSNKIISLDNITTGMYIIQVYNMSNKLIGTEKLIKK